MEKQRFIKPKIDKYIQLYSKNARLEEVNDTGFLSDIVITNKGYWYQEPPLITFEGGGGSGATAEAIIDNEYDDEITSIKITNRGSGYTSAPTVVITPVPSTIGEDDNTAVVWGVFITNKGSGYTSTPSVSITGGGGSGATGTAIISGGLISEITMSNVGSGYTSAPSISITGGGGSGASAMALVSYGLFGEAKARISQKGTRVFKYAWDLDESVEINENALLQVVDRQYTIQNRYYGQSDVIVYKPIVVRIHEIGTKSIINAKNLQPDSFFQGKIIDIGKPERFLPNDIKLEINPQNINRIVLSLDWGITQKTGFNKDDEFVIILKITEKEPSSIEFGALNNVNTFQ